MPSFSRQDLLRQLRRDAARIAARFDLAYQSVDAEDARVKRRYGSCDAKGRIWIRLRHARTGEPLKYSSLIDTLCHELAHLRYFHHGPAFRAFYFYLLDWAREQGIYRPTPRKVRGVALTDDRAKDAALGLTGAGEERSVPVAVARTAATTALTPGRRRSRPKPRVAVAEQLPLL